MIRLLLDKLLATYLTKGGEENVAKKIQIKQYLNAVLEDREQRDPEIEAVLREVYEQIETSFQ